MNADVTTILNPLRANIEKHPDKLLYAFLDINGRTTQSYSYEAFVQRTTDIASHIHRMHPLKPGERVLLIYPPGVEMICAFFACVRLGLIPVPVCPPSSQGFEAAIYKMNFIAQDCQASAVLTDRSYFWSIKLHRTRTNIAAFSLSRDYTSKLKWIVTSDAESNAQAAFPEAHSEILFLQYTSGSTSDPKGVMVTHRNIVSNCDTVFDHAPIGVSWLPQYHDMGLIGAYIFLAIKGGTTYGFAPLDFIQRPLLWLETISRYRATASVGPNFAYEYCLRPDKIEDESLTQLDLSSLELLMNGAEPVRANVFGSFLKKFGPYGLAAKSFCSAYGLAEYTLAVSSRGSRIRSFDATRITENEVCTAAYAAPAAETTTLVSCGRPLGSTEVKIVDVAGTAHEAPEGRIGEIWVDGPSKCLGYWDRPQLTKQIFEAQIGGVDSDETRWLRTGDLGFMQDGELFVCGRAKDLIIIRGLNYYPQDIEAIVEEDPAIRKGCVAAFSVEQNGCEVLAVVAELKNVNRIPETENISRSIRQRLGIVAESFVYIPARTIPKTSSGKIVRHKARARWRENRLKVVARVEAALPTVITPDDRARGEAIAEGACDNSVRAALDGIFGRYGLTGTESLTLGDAGLDSLGMAEFAADLENHLKARGESDLAASIDIRWLQKIAITELFELLEQVNAAAPRARVRFQRAFATLRRENQEIELDMMRRDARLGFDPSELPAVDSRLSAVDGGILLTGGTGFFGPFLLRSLLEQCDDEIYVVVRAQDAAHGRERLREGLASLDSSMNSSLPEDWTNPVTPICGDLSQPNLGVSTANWTFLSENIHTIYHNGALVNYLLDYASMRAINVGGTRDLVRLALSRRPKILNHISTTFVFGWSSRDTLFENDNNQDMELLDFGYSQSKWVSEQIVLNAMRQGLSARVFRPALITPSVSGGGYNFDLTP